MARTCLGISVIALSLMIWTLSWLPISAYAGVDPGVSSQLSSPCRSVGPCGSANAFQIPASDRDPIGRTTPDLGMTA